jgi:tetratricopeptide (TPR) repeat protein
VAGAYDWADALLASAEEVDLKALHEAEVLEREAHEAVERRRRSSAAAWAKRGEIALIEPRYLEAAEHFQAAAAIVPADDYDLRGRYLHGQAGALYEHGERLGDNDSLRRAVAPYRAALEESTRERVPLDWAKIQHNFGNALQTLGAGEAGTGRLEEAVAVSRAALEEHTRACPSTGR